MCYDWKKDGGKCIFNNVKLIATFNQSDFIFEGFQTLLQSYLNTF
jgi:hypothetical protein